MTTPRKPLWRWKCHNSLIFFNFRCQSLYRNQVKILEFDLTTNTKWNLYLLKIKESLERCCFPWKPSPGKRIVRKTDEETVVRERAVYFIKFFYTIFIYTTVNLIIKMYSCDSADECVAPWWIMNDGWVNDLCSMNRTFSNSLIWKFEKVWIFRNWIIAKSSKRTHWDTINLNFKDSHGIYIWVNIKYKLYNRYVSVIHNNMRK